jgi:SAM-dependent methyltransferase
VKALAFNSAEDTKKYYDDRYLTGYMDAWDEPKIRMVSEIVDNLQIPTGAMVLDFGCGTGVFTRLLKDLLPSREVHGADISQTAVDVATQRHTDIRFFPINAATLAPLAGRFDVIFTHHVLEHVFDLDAFAHQIVPLLKPMATMIHILPCANPHSFEYEICALYPDGIDKTRGNRFFCEDPGHLRRMATDDVCRLFQPFGFKLKHSFYSNQFWGALRWVSETNPTFIGEFFDAKRAASKKGRVAFYHALCSALFWLRFPARMNFRQKFHGTPNASPRARLRSAILGIFGLTLFLPSLVFDRLITGLAKAEWKRRKNQPNGSEMALILNRASVST